MAVVGMRRFGRQKAKGGRIWVTSIGLSFKCIWEQSEDLSLFCLCTNRYKMLLCLRLQTRVLCHFLACE